MRINTQFILGWIVGGLCLFGLSVMMLSNKPLAAFVFFCGVLVSLTLFRGD